jgi:hypothetical protein
MRPNDAGGFPGEVVVEPDEYAEFGQGFVADIDPAQGVWHRPGRIGDDERISGVGFRLSGVIGRRRGASSARAGTPRRGRRIVPR